jgi:7-cyano-7-deazaguanine synthase in queuosine biosynthesis
MDAVVLLNSGGIDSRVSAAMLGTYKVHSLYIDWNPRNSAAAQAAAQITADRYCADHTVLPWGADWVVELRTIGGWGHPYTNLLGLSIAAAFSAYRGAVAVASGVRAEVTAGPGWRDAMVAMLSSPVSGIRRLVLPVYDMSDDEVTLKARAAGIDLTTTWSCTFDPACGRCHSCARRRRAVR